VSFDLSSEVAFVTSTPSCTDLGGIVSCPLDEISAGSSAEVVLTVQVSSSTFVSHITSEAEVASAVADPSQTNNNASADTGVGWSAGLGIDIIDTPDPVGTPDVGGPAMILTYTLVYTNYGPSDAVSLEITNVLPPQVDFLRAYPNICQMSPIPHTVICKPVLDMVAGHTDQVDLVVSVKLGTTQPLEDQVEITSLTADPFLNDNQSEETTGIDPVNPSLRWDYPVNDEQAKVILLTPGLKITLTVTASDTFGIDRVHFRRWDHVREVWIDIGTDYEGDQDVYEVVWVVDNAVELPMGDNPFNAFYAYAYDNPGNEYRRRIWIIPYYVLLPYIVK